MKKIKFLSILLFAMGLFVLNACDDDDKDPEPEETKTTFTKDIAPLVNGSCNFNRCHNSGSQFGSTANYADTKAFAQEGKWLGALKHQTGFVAMPKGGQKYSDANIAKVEAWINEGYLE